MLPGDFAGREPVTLSDLRMTLALHGPSVANEKPIEITDLCALADYASPEIRYFSGEATYRVKFRVAHPGAQSDGPLLFDLGKFEAIADVILNDRHLGEFWKPGISIDVTGLVRDENELLIRVVTVYRSRLIGDLAQFGKIKHLQTSSPVTNFLSAKSPLKASGLLGPITLFREHPQRVSGF